jgi:ferredoxin
MSEKKTASEKSRKGKNDALSAKFRRLRFAVRAAAAYGVLIFFMSAYFSSSAKWNGAFAALAGWQFSAALYGTGAFSAAVICLLAVSAASGRFFCSALCPMGTLQEFFFRIWRSGKARFVSPWKARYLVPFASGLYAAFLGEALIAPDPISSFGRGMGSILAAIGGSFDWLAAYLAIPFFLILAMSFLRGRRFCDWCPVGLTLGFFSGVAPFGMRISDGCVSCGICEKKCPANCINAKEKKIEPGRCVLCFSCEAACPGGFAYYGADNREKSAERRMFLKTSAAGLSAFFSCAVYLLGPSLKFLTNGRNLFQAHGKESEGQQAVNHILPPGAGNLERYLSLCIGCQVCVAACPVRIVKAKNSPHPELDYSDDFCQYNCVECGRVCPTGAIRHLSQEEKRRTRVALSSLMFDRCVVVTKEQACGACAEVCPTRALRMIPYEESPHPGLTRPVFDEQYCIGCGACLVVCPAEPVAFSVNAVAAQAMTQGIRPTDESEDGLPPLPGLDEFPF